MLKGIFPGRVKGMQTEVLCKLIKSVLLWNIFGWANYTSRKKKRNLLRKTNEFVSSLSLSVSPSLSLYLCPWFSGYVFFSPPSQSIPQGRSASKYASHTISGEACQRSKRNSENCTWIPETGHTPMFLSVSVDHHVLWVKKKPIFLVLKGKEISQGNPTTCMPLKLLKKCMAFTW